MCKCATLQKPGVCIVLPLIKSQNQKNSGHYSGDIYQKKLARNFTRFHGSLFELEILEIFTTAFLLKTII